MHKEPELKYPELYSRWKCVKSENDLKQVENYLIGIWLDDYYSRLADSALTQVVQTSDTGFSYLFDIQQERLIAAWGISKGKSGTPRDRARMKSHPLMDGPKFHRGHVIPHQMGGSTDINLVSQAAHINIGQFRIRENTAVRTPGALYFTYWVYEESDIPTEKKKTKAEIIKIQTPAHVQQAVLCPGLPADSKWFKNSA